MLSYGVLTWRHAGYRLATFFTRSRRHKEAVTLSRCHDPAAPLRGAMTGDARRTQAADASESCLCAVGVARHQRRPKAGAAGSHVQVNAASTSRRLCEPIRFLLFSCSKAREDTRQ